MKEKKKINANNLNTTKNTLSLFSTFYIKFYILETLLKKKIIHQLEIEFTSDWLDATKMHINLFKEESEIISKRKKNDFKITTKLFIHEASFGFWIELFGRETYKQLKGVPIKIFTDLPKEIKRNDLYRMLSNIKELRNNLYHHRINLSNQLSYDQIKHLQDTNKDLEFLIDALDKEYLSLIDLTAFEKGIKKILIK